MTRRRTKSAVIAGCRQWTTKKIDTCGKIADVIHWYQDEYRFAQNNDGSSRTLEQSEIIELLMQQSTGNPDQIDLEGAIQQMIDAHEVEITF